MERRLATKFFLKRQKRKRGKLIQSVILFTLLACAIGFAINFFIHSFSGKSGILVNPFVVASSNSVNKETSQIVKNPLAEAVNGALLDSKGDYAVVIKNLKTGETYFKNENKSYETGSLYKLWVMATVYKQIQDGILTKDEVLEDNIATLNQKFSIAPEDAEMTSGYIDMTVAEALKQMITISHNYAAMLLTDKIKVSSVENFLKLNGFINSALGDGANPPKSTASDICLFLEKLYKGQLADPVGTTEMIDILKAQTFDDGLPKYLPSETIMGNKTGDIGWFKHDAGIVFSEKGDYIIVVMSQSDSPLGAQGRIALISKAVYEYFNK